MNLGEKLRFFGETKYSLMKDFAEDLGIKPSNLTAYMKNEVSPGADLLMKLHNLGCDLNWLLTTDEKSPPVAAVAPAVQQLEEENKMLIEENTRLRATINAELVLLSQKLNGIGVTKNSKKNR